MRIALLRPAQQPLLDRGAAVGQRQHLAVVDLELVEQLADDAAFGVLADDRGQDRLRPQGREHRGHAARPAQAMLLLADPQHGDGGLGADPLHVAPDVAIQHHVAHQQNAGAEVLFQQAKRKELDIRVGLL